MIQLGLDYASVDGNSAPDWGAVTAAGARFVIIRKSYVLTDGSHATHLVQDSTYERDAANARAAGLTVGAYAFLSFANNGPSAREQISGLINGPGKAVPGKDLPYCLDVEFPGKGISETGRTKPAVFAFLLELIAEVRRQAGVSPMLYTSHVQWHDDNGLGGPDAPELDGCPLWIKTPYRLLARRPPDPKPPLPPHFGPLASDPNDYWRVPRPWERQGFWLHQYQGDAIRFPGLDKTVDISQFTILDEKSHDQLRTTWMQRAIAILGAPSVGPLNSSGMWDADTRTALARYQLLRGISQSGVLDVETFASLCW